MVDMRIKAHCVYICPSLEAVREVKSHRLTDGEGTT